MDADGLTRGVELFNGAEFFAAHEALEDVWRAAPMEEKKFFQGLTQVAVAFHHHSTGNFVGMQSVLRRAMSNLKNYPAQFCEIDVRSLLESLARWADAIDRDLPPPPLPRIRRLASRL